jgi:hypothetical protein
MAFPSRPWVALAAISMAALGCSVLDSLPGGGGGGGTGVLFEDDFSNSSSGWDQVGGGTITTDYQGGEYVIRIDDEQNTDAWANPGRSFGDVRVEVDATKADGDDNNNFGLICRSQNVGDFYSFWIGSDGTFSIVEFKDRVFDYLLDWDRSAAINQGNATNRVRADCIGTELSLYANGTLLGTASDSSYSDGDVGLEAGWIVSSGTEIRFDNFVVYQP